MEKEQWETWEADMVEKDPEEASPQRDLKKPAVERELQTKGTEEQVQSPNVWFGHVGMAAGGGAWSEDERRQEGHRAMYPQEGVIINYDARVFALLALP